MIRDVEVVVNGDQPGTLVDSDNDGVVDAEDAFPNDPLETADTDNDGVGDNADAFPNDSSETLDTDSDGIGNNTDPDDDGDGVNDDEELFPLNPYETVDTDGDGVGDTADVNNSSIDFYLLDAYGNLNEIFTIGICKFQYTVGGSYQERQCERGFTTGQVDHIDWSRQYDPEVGTFIQIDFSGMI